VAKDRSAKRRWRSRPEGSTDTGVAVAAASESDDLETCTALFRRAEEFASQSLGAEAIELYQSALEGFLRLLGPDHRDTRNTRNRIAVLADRLGDPRAEEFQRAVLADWERLDGPYEPGTLVACSNLARIIEGRGRLEEAEQLYRDLVDDHERVFGEDHPGYLANRNNLGSVLISLGRLEEAETLYGTLAADHERVFGPDDPRTLIARHNHAFAVRRVGRLHEAARMYEDVLADRERLLGPDHRTTKHTREELKATLRDLGAE
jgi:tetratricopeptide (TPR) repeat protein